MHSECKVGLNKVPFVIGENIVQEMLVNDIDLPEGLKARKIRNSNFKFYNLNATILNDKILIQGFIHNDIYYIDHNNKIRLLEREISFSKLIDLPGSKPGMKIIFKPDVEYAKYELLQEGKLIHQKLVLQYFIKVLFVKSIDVIEGSDLEVIMDRIVANKSKQIEIFDEATLPEGVEEINEVKGSIENIDAKPSKDQIIFEGFLDIQIYYRGKDGANHHLGKKVYFSNYIDVPDVRKKMDVDIATKIEHINYELSACNHFNQKIVVKLFISVTEKVIKGITTGKGPLVKLPRLAGKFKKQIMLDESLQMEQKALDIKDIKAKITDIRTEIINNKVIVKGYINKEIYYIGDDHVEHHQDENIPFSTYIDAPGVRPGMEANVKAGIESIIPALSSSGYILNQKVILFLKLFIVEDIQVKVKCTGITGQVTDSFGKPAAGFIVKAVNKENPECEYLTLTDENGYYSMCVKPGKYKVFVLRCPKGCIK